jgi:biotin synthase
MTNETRLSSILETLFSTRILSFAEFCTLIDNRDASLPDCDSPGSTTVRALCKSKAAAVARSIYGNTIFVRGLIEFTNYCKNNCLYCGIRAQNGEAHRYRLDKEDILNCTDLGYELGFRTFVLQGGEDPFFTDDLIADIVRSIKSKHPDCAVTLSIGEKEYDTYKLWKDAGADRYLLRHETASDAHYRQLHPATLSPEHRKQCLWNLKELGYQTGAGFMVGSPYQTTQHIAQDLLFLHDLNPQMIGIGPFIHHDQTPFAHMKDGTCEETLFLLSVLRIMFPNVLLPATTALGTIQSDGREQGILCGANVIMPNLSPVTHRKDYALYNNKICTGEEAAECVNCLKRRVESIGYEIVTDRGDYKQN